VPEAVTERTKEIGTRVLWLFAELLAAAWAIQFAIDLIRMRA
jgi:hypothetical protein